jgi:type I restriction-modification system DNA methylase subunit
MSEERKSTKVKKLLSEATPGYIDPSKLPTSEEMEEIWKDLEEQENELNNEFLENVVEIVTKENLDNSELALLEYEFLNASRAEIGQYFSPKELVDFIVKLPILKEEKVILDPVCGTGTFLSRIKNRNHKTECYGVDIDHRVIRLAKALAKEREQEIFFYCQDSLEKYKENIPSPDYIFAELPFGVKVKDNTIRKKYETKSRRLEVLLVEKIIRKLKQDGLAFIVVPESLLWSNHSSLELHKYIRENASLEAIFSLPRGIFAPYTAAKTSIIVIRKAKRRGHSALYSIDSLKDKENTILDFQEYIKTGKSGLAQISRNHDQMDNWSLIFFEGVQKYNELLSSIEHKYTIKKIGELSEIKRSSIKELSKNAEGYDLIIDRNCSVIENFEELKNPNKRNLKKYVTIRVTSDSLLPEYLKILFLSDFGIKANKSLLSLGTNTEELSIRLIKEFEIPIVPLPAQLKIINLAFDVDELISNKEREITKLKSLVKKKLFEKDAFLSLSSVKTESRNKDYYQKMPYPIAHGIMLYKNTTNIDKKYENLTIALELTIKTLGAFLLASLNDVVDEDDIGFLRREIDITRPISIGAWTKVIIRAVKKLEKNTSLLYKYSDSFNIREFNKLLSSLVSKRNKKSHSFNTLSDMMKEGFVNEFENELDRLINFFSFLGDYPLIYIQGSSKSPHSFSHSVTYLVGDNRTPNEARIEQQEDFMSTLYLYSKEPNKSIQLYPLMIYESCPLAEEKDIFFFMKLNKNGEPEYKSLLKGSEIIKSENSKDIYKMFYYTPKEDFLDYE